MEIKADTQVAKMFVEQLGRDNAKLVDVPLGFDPDHFGYGRESHKAIKEELDERAKYKICSIGKDDLGGDVKNLAKMTQTSKKRDVKICLSYDEAEGQRPNLSSVMNMTDMSKLSLGRMKYVQNVS